MGRAMGGRMTAATNEPDPVTILVDADACPVKEEIYRVAERHGAHVRVVSNSAFCVPVSERVKRVMVGDRFDAADDWIAQNAGPRSVVVTADILLAERCLKAGATVLRHAGPRSVVVTADILLAERCLQSGARVLKHDGREYDTASIGSAVATRAIMADLRAGMDGIGGGPPPFGKADRSRFLQALDRVLVRMR